MSEPSSVCLAPGQAGDAPAAASISPATIPLTRQVDFTSGINGKSYRLQVALPFSPPPPNGFPVVYVLDGDYYFGTFAAAARGRAMFGQDLQAAIIVGVGYPDASEDPKVSMVRRSLDLTPTEDPTTVSFMKKIGMEPEAMGGADAFLDILEKEVKPRVAAMAPVDASHSTLFGHSLGGLFVLHALFTRPTSFSTFLAISPSIWWDGRSVLRDEAAFARRVSAGDVTPRVFIAVGGDEETPPKRVLPGGPTKAEIDEQIRHARMVGNAKDLAERLKALKGKPGFVVKSRVYGREDHMTVPFASLHAMLDFALPLP